MATQKWYNSFLTDLTSGYTAGDGVLVVTSTTGCQADSSVVVCDASTGETILIFRVTSVPDGTHLNGAAEGSDVNAANGSKVRGSAITAAAMTALTSELRNIGHPFGPVNNQISTNNNFQNFSIMATIRGESLSFFPASWFIRMRFTSGSPVIGGMKILKTLSYDTAVISSTTVTIGSVSNPTLSSPTLVDTDTISLQLDSTHDYYFVMYFTNTGANASVVVVANGPGNIPSGFVTGDQTGVSTIPSITYTANPNLIIATISVS